MARTKKAGISGRFGPRYGSTLRKRVKKIEEKMKERHKCPQCELKTVHRVSTGGLVRKGGREPRRERQS